MLRIRSALLERTATEPSCERVCPALRLKVTQVLVIACFFGGCLPAVFAYADAGAYGPYATTVRNLPSLSPATQRIPPAPVAAQPTIFQVNPATDQPVTAAILPATTPQTAWPLAPNTSFYSPPNIDMTAATNGT